MKTIVLILLFSLLDASLARAQTSGPVYISFSFQVASATNNIRNLDAVERAISDRLAQKCAVIFPYWTVVRGETNQYPALRIWLAKDGEAEEAAWSIHTKLFLLKVPPKGDWRGNLFAPSEFIRLAGTLTTNRWADLIEQHFEADLLAANASSIQTSLQTNVPLGRGLVLTDPPPLDPDPREYAVLPLEWQRYELMQMADFLIQCRTPNEIVLLHSVGVARKAEFTPKHRLFDGIVVHLRDWEPLGGPTSPFTNHLNELKNLQPLVFFLKTPREPPSEWERVESP